MDDPRTDVTTVTAHGSSAFVIACCNGHVRIVKMLADHPDVDAASVRWQGATAFFMACFNNRVEVRSCGNCGNCGSTAPLPDMLRRQVVKYLAALPSVDINESVEGGPNPFMVACFKNNIEVVKFLTTDPRIDVHQCVRVLQVCRVCARWGSRPRAASYVCVGLV